MILHVVDATDPDPLGQIATVRNVIAEVEASAIPELIVFNKADLVDEDEQIRLRGLVPGSLLVSARTGLGIESLERAIAAGLPQPDVEFRGVIPYHRGDLISRAHLAGKVLETEYLEQGTRIVAMVSADLNAEMESARQS